ncbi:hypothetical protein [Paenibacillus lacisoli]|nr:hypothetical protein [Paenibacillus sp. JX-17]
MIQLITDPHLTIGYMSYSLQKYCVPAYMPVQFRSQLAWLDIVIPT